MGRCGCRDALGSAGLVVTVAGGVVGSDGEVAQMGNAKAVAAVGGIDAHLLRAISRGPYLCGGDDATLGGVGSFSRGDYLAGYSSGVLWGIVRRSIVGFIAVASIACGKKQYECDE